MTGASCLLLYRLQSSLPLQAQTPPASRAPRESQALVRARNASLSTALPMKPLTVLRRLLPAQTALTTRPLDRRMPPARMLFPLRPLLVQGIRATARVQRLTPPTSTPVLPAHILLPELCSRLRLPDRTAQMEMHLYDLRRVSPLARIRPSESKRRVSQHRHLALPMPSRPNPLWLDLNRVPLQATLRFITTLFRPRLRLRSGQCLPEAI